MEQQQPKQQNGGNGFILGVIVGVMIALLFTTKKGRAILRDITEKGIDKLSSLEDLAKRANNGKFDEFEDEDDYVKPEPVTTPQPAKAPESVAKVEEKKEEPKPVAKPAPIEPKPEPKPAPKPGPEPKVEAKEEESEQEEPQEKAPTKVIQGRRWFRGLRKKG